MSTYRESVLQFGHGQGLLGILTQPDSESQHDVGVIMLNAGLLHRVGPFRMHVQLARQLAQRGISSLRLDLSGLGDSAARRSGKSVQHNAMEDVRESIALLRERTQLNRFVILGLCSGAENAHHIGVNVADVAGLIMIDGILHKTRRYYIAHYLPRVLSVTKWADWLIRRAMVLSPESRKAAKLLAAAADIWDVPSPPIEQVSKELQTIVDNETEVLSIFTGGLGYCSYANQMRDAYSEVDFKGRLTTIYQKPADHTFSVAAHRKQLFKNIEEWLFEKFTEPSTEG